MLQRDTTNQNTTQHNLKPITWPARPCKYLHVHQERYSSELKPSSRFCKYWDKVQDISTPKTKFLDARLRRITTFKTGFITLNAAVLKACSSLSLSFPLNDQKTHPGSSPCDSLAANRKHSELPLLFHYLYGCALLPRAKYTDATKQTACCNFLIQNTAFGGCKAVHKTAGCDDVLTCILW